MLKCGLTSLMFYKFELLEDLRLLFTFLRFFFLIFRDWNAIERQLNDFVDIFVEQFFEPTKHRLAARAN